MDETRIVAIGIVELLRRQTRERRVEDGIVPSLDARLRSVVHGRQSSILGASSTAARAQLSAESSEDAFVAAPDRRVTHPELDGHFLELSLFAVDLSNDALLFLGERGNRAIEL